MTEASSADRLPEAIEKAFHRFGVRHGCAEHMCADLRGELRAAIRAALDEATACRDCRCECHKEDA